MFPRHRLSELDKALALAGFGLLLVFVAQALRSYAEKGGFVVCLIGSLFFGCGGGTLPLRTRRTAMGWLLVGLGLTLMAVGLVWFFRGPIPWLVRVSDGLLVLALVFMALGLLWMFVRWADDR